MINNKIQTALRIVALLILSSTLSLKVIAQPGPGGPGTSGTSGSGPVNDFGSTPQVPFDGRMSIVLVVTGVLYLSKKIKDRGIIMTE